MPNPIFYSQKANQSDKAMALNRKAITPVEYEEAGDNHAYRGTEAHGVPKPFVAWEEPDSIVDPGEEHEVQYEEHYKRLPVPTLALRKRTYGRAIDVPLEQLKPQQLLPEDHKRVRVLIRERTSVGVRLISENSNSQIGFTLPQGAAAPIEVQAGNEIWVMPIGAAPTVEMYYEWETQESYLDDDGRGF